MEKRYTDKEMLEVKQGQHEDWEQVHIDGLEDLDLTAWTCTQIDRDNAVIFSKTAKKHLWWSTGFESKSERDEAIQNTVIAFKILGMKRKGFKFAYVAPQDMFERDYFMCLGNKYNEKLDIWK